MELEIYIHEENCNHCIPTLKFLTAVIGALKTDEIKLKVHQVNKNRETAEKKGIPLNPLPAIVLPSGCIIAGSLSHDLIGVLICSLLSKSKVPVQSVDKFELNKKEALIILNLASAMIEYQAAYTLRRDRSYTFVIKESTEQVPLERYKQLSKNTKMMILTNFDECPSSKLYELGLDSNVYLGHIIRDNIILSANLIIWRERANHISFFRVKRSDGDKYVGTCSCLLGDGKQMIREFYKPLFLTAATIEDDGTKGLGQNRIVANVKEASTDLDQLIRR
ncbi:MAG: hypothetical protein H7647_09745 [Candidatus Heimdallarchaeota archaeon]|nr:hypothetical protein [Candidatus Heimdallarchaeota archaeon]MCK4254709.1 hypothetical protein [Candidatus Heimdallarchaeota archaeon]